MIDAILTNTLLPQISQKLLTASRDSIDRYILALSRARSIANLPLTTLIDWALKIPKKDSR